MAGKPISEWPILNWWIFRPFFWIYGALGRLFLPFMTIWRNERPMLWLFCSVNILVAQISIFASFWMAAERSIDFGRVLQQNLLNASFYVFSVSLLVTTAAILVAEYLELDGKDELRGHKMSWGIVAALLVLFQVMFTGNLISDSLRADTASAAVAAPAVPVEKQKPDVTVVAKSDQKALRQPTAAAPENVLLKILKTIFGSNQLLLWLLSMFVAVHIFCLTRMHSYPEELHQLRNRQLDKAQDKAKHLHMTSDAMKV